jgi:hypothetical protein
MIMKINIPNKTMASLKDAATAATELCFEAHSEYISDLYLRGRDADEFVRRLRKDVLHLTGLPFSVPLARRTHSAILEAYFRYKPKRKGKYEFYTLAPCCKLPVVTRNPSMEVGPDWAQAIKYFGTCAHRVDGEMLQAVAKHRNQLLHSGGDNATDNAEKYCPAHVIEVLVDMYGEEQDCFVSYHQLQESGRIIEELRGGGSANNKISRALLLDTNFTVCNKENLEIFESAIRLKYGVSGKIKDWASRVIDKYDVSDHHRCEEINLACGWRDIISKGGSHHTIEIDAHTSGMVHMLMQVGLWKRRDICSRTKGWEKLYTRIARMIRMSCPWAGHLPMSEIMSIAKKVMSPSMYGGGSAAIVPQFFKNVQHNDGNWVFPSRRLVVPDYYQPLFEESMKVYDKGVGHHVDILSDTQDGLTCFDKEVTKKYSQYFRKCFPFVKGRGKEDPGLFGKFISHGEDNPNGLIELAGMQIQIHPFTEDKLRKVGVTAYDEEGYRHSTGIYPLVESSYTDLMAKCTHLLDSYQMALFGCMAEEEGVCVRPILDAVKIPIGKLKWALETASQTFLHVHAKPRFPVGTEGFKVWQGETPSVWGF